MKGLIERLRGEFQDKTYRDAYAEECLNAMIASQIKALREQRSMTQKQLADATGMGQPRIPLLEDASYENWTINTLKRLARAFDVALSVKFETFSQVILDFENLNRETLQRASFPNDVQFHSPKIVHRRNRRSRLLRRSARKWAPQILQVQASGMGAARKPSKSAQGGIPSSQNANELGNYNYLMAAAGGN